MNIVFIHPGFPGQFRFLAEMFGKDKRNKTIFITSVNKNKDRQIPGVRKIIFSEKMPGRKTGAPSPPTSPGLSVANILAGLKKQNYIPNLIIGTSGSGTCLYVKDVFPDTPFLCFFEWFHNQDNLPDNLNSTAEPDLKVRMKLRNRNLPVLADLYACDHGICPSGWQKSQFPKEFHSKLSVVHNGIDIGLFQPGKDQKFKTGNLDLSGVGQLVTYTANVLAPYKGFQQFMESLPAVLEQKPDVHVVIVGADHVVIKDKSGNKASYKSLILEKVKLDPDRVHFMDELIHEEYKRLLQASAVHICLDSPLVVSKFLLCAMSCECLVIAPDIAPVKEVITDGANGIIADFSSPDKIAEKIVACLDYPSFMTAVRQKARQTIAETYAIEKNLPLQLDIIKKLIHQGKPLKQFG
ncbi:glycosyltransferase [Desulfobacula phenolica]|uniref:Glycosyltransferase involved in cell wall bisynthesis n=1 Tax=Desulfobacula phenolica TaxID=90732 RepID=A0A1H2HEI5_9BACT|nr:glycosyltransferase [Desulfobacula phenolica]SDU30243.1 Glycosyltransferase involved in cell wall bisynthesis [Desulfobacula phenolica]